MVARLRIGTRSGQPSKAAAGARPTSSASATGAWRSTASSSARQRRAPRGPRRCTRPGRRRRARRASGRSRAGPAGPAAPPSRMARAMRPRVVAGRLRAELEVEGDERRARGDEDGAGGRVHAVAGRSRGSRPSAIRCARPGGAAPAQLGARAPAGQQAVEEDGQAELAEGVGQRERLGQRGAALRRRSRKTTGATSMAPDVRVQARRGGVRSMRSIASRAPVASASCSVPGSAASVKTARLWSGSSWRSRTRAPPAAKASPMASRTAASRPSETLGTARSTLRARSARRRAPSCRRSSASRRSPRRRGGSGPRPCRRSPRWRRRRRGSVPRIFSSSRMLPVSRARVVGADAELGEVRALLAGAGEQLVEALALGPGRLRQAAALDGQVRRVALDEADGGQRARGDRALSARRRDEALAARQVAERARRGEVAVVGDALRGPRGRGAGRSRAGR